MEEYLHNFKAIEKGRGPSPLNSVECGKNGNGDFEVFLLLF
jgi:hypothetical protein